MLTPTTAELRTAIEVLKKLGERINTDAAHSVIQLPDTSLNDHYAGRIEVRAIEQTNRIETVAGQLKNWRDELLQQRRQNVSQSV
jgi:Mg2+/Co2+ transporter CorB